MTERRLGDIKQTREMPIDEFGENLRRYDERLDRVYDEWLADEELKDRGARTISMAEVPEEEEELRSGKLSRKLLAYEDRLREANTNFPFLSNAPTVIVDSMYKRDVLRLLLERGEVNTWALCNAYADIQGKVIPKFFKRACGVIHEYVRTGGQNVRGGEGL